MNITNISSINANASSFSKDLLANAMALACEIPKEQINTSSHLDLKEFLITACSVVVLLTALNTLQSILKKVFTKMKGTIEEKYDDYSKKQKTSNETKNTKVTPVNNSNNNGETSTVDKQPEENNTQNVTDNDNKEEIKHDIDNIETVSTTEKNDNNSNAEEDEDEAEDDENDESAILENVNEVIDEIKGNIEEEHGLGQIEMILHTMQAICTIYSVVTYWYDYIPNLNGKSFRVQLLCRAVHLTMLPLFKPVSISM